MVGIDNTLKYIVFYVLYLKINNLNVHMKRLKILPNGHVNKRRTVNIILMGLPYLLNSLFMTFFLILFYKQTLNTCIAVVSQPVIAAVT